MGYKLLKQEYRIEHAVHVTDNGICIGSPYVHDLIVIGLDGTIIKGDANSTNRDLRRYMDEMTADPDKLRRVIQSLDTFDTLIPVYTYDGGNIVEKTCERLGWPNVTTDGRMMYENTYSADKAKVVEWAKRNAECGIEMYGGFVEEAKTRLAELEAKIRQAKADLAKLNAEYP